MNAKVMHNRDFGAIVLLILIFSFSFWGCSRQEKYDIDIPAGYATYTLKEFAKQAKVEIIFDALSIVDIKTNAVEGTMTPDAALGVMLNGTYLLMKRDLETGAYAVTIVGFPVNEKGVSIPDPQHSDGSDLFGKDSNGLLFVALSNIQFLI